MLKKLAVTSFILSFLTLSNAFAVEVKSTKEVISPSRVVELVKLVNKDDIKVSVVVSDIGGSTDVSPTQELYLTLYVKGEMYNTDATFNLGPIYKFISAKRISGGVYEVEAEVPNEENWMPEVKTLVIDAQSAIISIKAVSCDDFDCDASTQFEASVDVEKK